MLPHLLTWFSRECSVEHCSFQNRKMGTIKRPRGSSPFEWVRQVLIHPLAPTVAVPASAVTSCQVPRDDHHSSLQGDCRMQVVLEHRSWAWTHRGRETAELRGQRTLQTAPLPLPDSRAKIFQCYSCCPAGTATTDCSVHHSFHF